jgi:hypothetical protein
MYTSAGVTIRNTSTVRKDTAMGLTIHYGLTSRTRSSARAEALVERMRQLALDLPFEHVEDCVRHLGPDMCQQPLDDLRGDDQLFGAVLDGSRHVDIPWHRKQRGSVSVQPLEIYSFDTIPGPGSEWASFGLARFPVEVEVPYSPRDDDRFIKTVTQGNMTRWDFDWVRWERWLKSNGHDRWDHPGDEKFQEQRKVKTKLGSTWSYSTFCKTQYASDPSCGGIPNFVRCHLCVVHLLDRIAELPTTEMRINDEGKYGRSYYTDDPWAKERVYTWHDGKYSFKALVEEVGEWNGMMAAMFGGLKDAVGDGVESPIASFPDFERLEFKGRQNHQYLAPFLKAMKQLGDKQREVVAK